MERKRKLRRLTKKEWVRGIMAKNIKSHDIEIKVTGVSMEGESKIDDNNRATGEDKGQSSKKENSIIREDGAGQSV